jgi:cytochrome c556
VYATVAFAALSAAVAAGCATDSRSMAKKMTPDQTVAERQRLMKLHGAVWADIQAKAKAGNTEAIAVSAETLAINAQRIPVLFPEGSMTDKSKAKPEIWQKWPEFEAGAKKMETEAEKLRDAARAKNTQLTDDIIKNFGREACGTCHTPFRVPPPRTS